MAPRPTAYPGLVPVSLRRALSERVLVADEVPILPLYHPAVRALVSPRIGGFSPNVMGLVSFRDLYLKVNGGE